MNTNPQIELQEVNMQERDIQALSDHSLPATQVIEEQKDDVVQNTTPRFIP